MRGGGGFVHEDPYPALAGTEHIRRLVLPTSTIPALAGVEEAYTLSTATWVGVSGSPRDVEAFFDRGDQYDAREFLMSTSPAPPGAREIFGDALPAAERYAELLGGAGVERGVIGPREVDRLWGRHLLNCAVVADMIPAGAEVVDVGSGAGLPGVVLAIARSDLSVTLLEPLLRRTVFLEECVDLLGLKGVTIRRARAEEVAGELSADVVTARAVAPLERLAGWAIPLLRPGGILLAWKGERAVAELDEAEPLLKDLAVRRAEVLRVGHGMVDPPATIVRVVAGKPRARSGRGRRRRGGAHVRKR